MPKSTNPWTLLRKSLSSLRLTVVLLAFSVALVFFGTLDQVHLGIRLAQTKYFESLIAVWSYPPQWAFAEFFGWIHLPLPGGYFLGPLLVINLIAAHFERFRPRWSKTGITLTHAGLILLLIGQLATQLMQEEYFMWLSENGSGNYIESFEEDELVVVDHSHPDRHAVYSFPLSLFQQRATTLRHPDLPFTIDVLSYLPNSAIVSRSRVGEAAPALQATHGIARDFDLVAFPAEITVRDNERNTRTAIVNIKGTNTDHGTWMISTIFRNRLPLALREFPDQVFQSEDGRTWSIAMRYKRAYLPATITLEDFQHDRYPGTEIPKNFSSNVRIHNAETGEDHRKLIYMNNPMRYAGYTFFQASFANQDTASMFQVVKNPGRLVPYIASSLMALGLLTQFLISLGRFARRRQKTQQPL